MSPSRDSSRKTNKGSCKEKTSYVVLHCGRLGLQRALIITSSINLVWAIFVLIWFWIIEETPYPPLLGFTWNTQMRVTLMPEACVSGGLSAYLLYGAIYKNSPALLVAILCQWLLVLGTFVFGFLYLLNVGFTPPMFLVMIWTYFFVRVYVLILNMQFFYELLGDDPWSRPDEAVVA